MTIDPQEPPRPEEVLPSEPPPITLPMGDDRGPVLFHYTDHVALQGIAMDGQLWATHARYLNDSSEVVQAYELAATICADRLMTEDAADSTLRPGIKRFIDYVRDNGHTSSDIYVVSMSESGDMLSQWRGYGDYAVGLDWNTLNSLPDWELVKCRYHPDEQMPIVSMAVDRALWELRAGDWNDIGSDRSESVMHALSSHIRRVAAAIKHVAFHEEREWRLINRPWTESAPAGEVRAARRSLIQYTRVNLPAATVRSVVVGPGPYREVRAEGALALLGAAPGLETYTVNQSSIPYLP